jgi:hypothetical protein
MAVGTEKNNVISSVVSARVFSVHLQHYRLAKPSVQSTDLASVTTLFYEPQTHRTLPNWKILPLLTRDRLLVSYAFVDRDVLYPTAHGSPGHVDLACDTPVSVAGPTQLDRPGILRFSVLIRTVHPYPSSYGIPACKVRCLCRLGYAPMSFGSIPVRFGRPRRCSRRLRGRAFRGARGSTRLSRWGWRRRGGGR